MFRTEEQKMRLYKANLKKEAMNQFRQGEKLQEYLLQEKGIDSQEANINRFAEAIGDSIGENFGETKRVRKLNKLDPTAIYDVDESGVSIKRQSAKQPKSIAQPPMPKTMKSNNTKIEREMMGAEDINMNNLMKGINSKPATENDLKTQAERQAELDLIALFQQDIKEGRKRQARKDLAQLTIEEDYRIRQTFMKVLDDMMDKVKDKRGRQFQEQLDILTRLQDMIEKQQLADAMERLEDNRQLAMNEFASKIQRNLKAAFDNKQLMKGVKSYNRMNNFTPYDNDMMIRNEQEERLRKKTKKIIDSIKPYDNEMMRRNELEARTRNKAATTIQQRMAELRARKADKKRSNSADSITSTATTSQMSDMPTTQRGAPRKYNSGNALIYAKLAKKEADEESIKLWERDENDNTKYKIRGGDRKKLTDRIKNKYKMADNLVKEFGLDN